MNKMILLPVLLLFTCALMGQQQHGYLNITSFGILAGTSADDKPAPLSLLSEHHYQFNRSLSLGAMTGIEQLNENTLPAALHIKAYLPLGKCILFIAGIAGYSISLEKPQNEEIQKATGGFLAGTEAGLMIKINSGSAVVVALGYRYNKLNYQLHEWWMGTYKREITYNRIAIRIGFAIF